jgi:carbonic anhydrase/acetyltransferase-like protein (isoleucine patch superfamily)
MDQLRALLERIIQRVNINLRETGFDAGPYVRNLVALEKMQKYYAFYGITPHHRLNFHFSDSNLAGSYFLGKCDVRHSVLYKSDIRGDELKSRGDSVSFPGFEISTHDDETIRINDSFLLKTLVHNYSHDPENLEEFRIQNTIATHYANIHGAPTGGSFLGPFSTVDLTTVHDCVIGSFAYIQVGEISHLRLTPGTVWVRQAESFNFLYRHDPQLLERYISFEPGDIPRGIFMEFVESRKHDFQRVFDTVYLEGPGLVPPGASVDRYAVIKRPTSIGENVLVAQRAYLENAHLGKGANAQENCYIIGSRLEGNDITAHGAKILHAQVAQKVFVGFNSFLRGTPDTPLSIGQECIVMPHTIIDLAEPLTVPPRQILWGLIRNREELALHSMPLEEFARIETGLIKGRLIFEGCGAAFIDAFRHRIEHILEANGAYFDGRNRRGHAQKNQNISFNTIQPYPEGELQGLYPSIDIRP